MDTRLGIQPSRHRAKNKRKKKVGPRGQEAGNPTSRVQGQKEKKKKFALHMRGWPPRDFLGQPLY